MKALVRIAPRRAELHTTRRAVLRWSIPIVLISMLAGSIVTATRYAATDHRRQVTRQPYVVYRTSLRPSRRERTYTKLAHAMYDSFPHWLARNPGAWCPSSVRDLLRASLPPQSTAVVTNLDFWHQPMELRCRTTPAGHTLQLRSAGRDGVFGTPDDLYISR